VVRVDEGEIVGRFDRAYDAWLTEDPTTPMQRQIEAYVDHAFRAGMVRTVGISVTTEEGKTWSHCFRANFDDSANCAFTTPNPYVLVVRVSGIGFAVDVRDPDSPVEVDITPITCAASDVDGGRMFLASFNRVYEFDGVRVLWASRRIALDEIDELRHARGMVTGVANVIGGERVPFTIDLASGLTTGGYQTFPGDLSDAIWSTPPE